MTTKLEALTQRLNADPALSDALSEYLREHAAERDALRAEVERLRQRVQQALDQAAEITRLRAFVRQLRADGLDIDDPTTAPVWIGKIYVGDRLVFDLATVGDPPSGSAPPICTWCGLPVETGKGMRVAHTFHGACWSAHGEWVDSLPHRGLHDEPCETCGAPAGVPCRR